MTLKEEVAALDALADGYRWHELSENEQARRLEKADAILPLVIERCAQAAERQERPREDRCCSAVYADCAAAIRKLKDEA